MIVLEFEVNNQILKRIDSQDIINNTENIYKCRFTFEEGSDWVDLNKFVIFKDGWGNPSTVHLGKNGDSLICIIPEKVLRGSYFQVSIYAGDLVTTNKVTIPLVESGYTNNKRYFFPWHKHYHHHFPYDNPKPHLHHPRKERDVFVEIFEQLDKNIDSIVYDEQALHLFNGDKLLNSVYLPFVNEDNVEELVEELVNHFMEIKIAEASTATEDANGMMSSEDKLKLNSIEFGANRIIVDDTLDDESVNPVMNKVITVALNGKEDSYNIIEKMDELIVNLINIDEE